MEIKSAQSLRDVATNEPELFDRLLTAFPEAFEIAIITVTTSDLGSQVNLFGEQPDDGYSAVIQFQASGIKCDRAFANNYLWDIITYGQLLKLDVLNLGGIKISSVNHKQLSESYSLGDTELFASKPGYRCKVKGKDDLTTKHYHFPTKFDSNSRLVIKPLYIPMDGTNPLSYLQHPNTKVDFTLYLGK